MSEFSGIGRGYGDSHHFVIESMAGGRDQYKHFVRECHRIEESHVDGLRVDLTQAMHRDNVLHAESTPTVSANALTCLGETGAQRTWAGRERSLLAV